MEELTNLYSVCRALGHFGTRAIQPCLLFLSCSAWPRCLILKQLVLVVSRVAWVLAPFRLLALSWALIFYVCRTLVPVRLEDVNSCWSDGRPMLPVSAHILFGVCVVFYWGCLSVILLSVSLFLISRSRSTSAFDTPVEKTNSIPNYLLSPQGVFFRLSPFVCYRVGFVGISHWSHVKVVE